MEMFRLGVQQATVGDWVMTFLIVGLVVYFTVPGLWFPWVKRFFTNRSKRTHETLAREKRKKE